MRLLSEKFERNSNAGTVTLKMESVEDMWHVYNIACRGDTIKSQTFRKIKEETKSGTTITAKKKITVVLKIVSIEYDPEAPCLRIGGLSVAESRFL
jgi:stalled ribosome rescue protein Dom34